MANETVEIIRIQFDAAEAIKATQQLKNERDKLIASGKELEKTEGKNSEAAIKNAAQIKVLNDSIREQEKVTQNLIKANQEAAGSNQQLKAQLSLATAELNRLSEAEKTTTDRGKELSGRVLDLTNKLKANESAVGNNFRNVGNYREALQGLGGGLGNAAKGITGFNQTLKANPVLAIVAAIQFFSGALSKLQPVVDAISVALGALNAVFDVLIERTKLLLSGDLIGAFTGVGDAISEAAESGAEYARVQKEIADNQQIQNIQNAQAEKQIAVLNVQLKDRTKTDEERLVIADQITRIEQQNFAKQQAILQATLKGEEQKVRQLLKTKGVHESLVKTTEQLVKAAQDFQLQDEGFEKLVAAQVALTNAEKESLTITERAELRRNQINDQANERRQKEIEKEADRRKKLEEERKKYNDNLAKLQEEFNLTEREKLAKGFDDKLKTITGNGAKEIELRASIEKKKLEALTKFDAEQVEKERELADKRDLAVLAILEDSLQNRLQAFEINFRKERAELEKNGNTAAQIEQVRSAKIAKIRAEFAGKDFNQLAANLQAQQRIEENAIDLAEGTEEEKGRKKLEVQLKFQQLQLEATRAFLSQDGFTDEELAKIRLLEQAIENVKQKLATPDQVSLAKALGLDDESLARATEAIAFIGSQIAAIQDQINFRTQVQLENIDKVNQSEIASIESSKLNEEEKKKKIDALNRDSAQKKYQLEKEQFEKNKAFSIVQTIINGAQGIIKALAELGPIAGAIAAAVVAGTTAAQIQTITSQKAPPPPKFADGVIGLDGQGNERSDSIPAYLSRGESVITASGTRFAQAAYPGLLEFLNTRNRFADGVVNFGQVSTTASPDIAGQIRAALSDLQIVTRVTDIEKATRDRRQVRTVGVI